MHGSWFRWMYGSGGRMGWEGGRRVEEWGWDMGVWLAGRGVRVMGWGRCRTDHVVALGGADRLQGFLLGFGEDATLGKALHSRRGVQGLEISMNRGPKEDLQQAQLRSTLGDHLASCRREGASLVAGGVC